MGRKGVSNDGKRYKIEILCARAGGALAAVMKMPSSLRASDCMSRGAWGP